jgi:hypothetical protein
MNKLFPAMIIKGEYSGLEGLATPMNVYGNVLFYPNDGIEPYRLCLKIEYVKYLD